MCAEIEAKVRDNYAAAFDKSLGEEIVADED